MKAIKKNIQSVIAVSALFALMVLSGFMAQGAEECSLEKVQKEKGAASNHMEVLDTMSVGGVIISGKGGKKVCLAWVSTFQGHEVAQYFEGDNGKYYLIKYHKYPAEVYQVYSPGHLVLGEIENGRFVIVKPRVKVLEAQE